MTIKLQIYRCKICGNLVQILHEGDGNLVCCGEEMELQKIQYDTNELGEKHAPKLEERDNKRFIHVKTHPMTEEHYIEFIETFKRDKSEIYIKFFKPNEIPEAEITCLGDDISALEYCNIHHLWGNSSISGEWGNYSI